MRVYNWGELKKQTVVTQAVFDEKTIQDAYNKKPNLPRSFRLAIYFKAPVINSRLGQEWRWKSEDKAKIEEFAQSLKTSGLVSDVFFLTSSIVENEDLKSLRLVAARHQADALLVVSGAASVQRVINTWGWTYVFLVPAFFVPGSEAHALFIASATLWDVKNEYLYLSAETEKTVVTRFVAAFGKDDDVLIDDSKTQTLVELNTNLKQMVQGTPLR